jgi:putative transposase
MARENPSWGEERIANKLRLKLGLRVSPRTIWKYLPESPAPPAGNPRRDQRWSTFLKNHAEAIIACDFCVVASATFRMLYVLVVMEHASRRIIHLNVTAHPSAAWTLQQSAGSHSRRPQVPFYPCMTTTASSLPTSILR